MGLKSATVGDENYTCVDPKQLHIYQIGHGDELSNNPRLEPFLLCSSICFGWGHSGC